MGRVAPKTDPSGTLWQRLKGSWLARLGRAQRGLTALLLMSVVGLGISIYLTIVHYDSKVSLLCTTGGVVNCQSVTSSAYSVIPGTSIPITIPGMLWFVALGALAGVGLWAVVRGVASPPRLRLYTLLWTIAGLAFVLYLVYCEIVLVQNICEWCTAVHLLTLASFLIALTRWQRRDEPDAPLQDAPAAPTTTAASAPPPLRPSGLTLSRRTRRTLSQRNPGAR
jgi:uncharacterized membrane protein